MDQKRKPNKRQKLVGKPAKKAAKRTRGPDQDTASTPDPETPESSSSRKSTDGEHISAIIKECLKSITPLLLKSGGARLGPDCTGKGKSQENHSKGEGSGVHAQGSDRATPGDPTPAWGIPSQDIEPGKSLGQPPEAYTRPSLGRPAMTTRAAGLANAIPLTVKERVWRKEFIDIFSLLEIQLEGLDLTVCDKKDEGRHDRKRAGKESNFENWLDTFRIMACVIVEKFLRCAADLWLYKSKIHEAHRQFPGDALLEYDKSFRLKMQAHPEMEWNEEDVSSYIHKMMVAKEVRSWAGRVEQPFWNSHSKGKYEKQK
ncbi:hypothetical protein NDU88_004875 [Pleurodeles waltl]|uniref:Retrotransposon gag domain-containing protein n=1 Tax=Pleurodeles waltl TaxID=8319 RepID=A0AAV7VK58_PLEWA|nr:hypothetical protein NDU88_004875 [Pleurodeles waltl]